MSGKNSKELNKVFGVVYCNFKEICIIITLQDIDEWFWSILMRETKLSDRSNQLLHDQGSLVAKAYL